MKRYLLPVGMSWSPSCQPLMTVPSGKVLAPRSVVLAKTVPSSVVPSYKTRTRSFGPGRGPSPSRRTRYWRPEAVARRGARLLFLARRSADFEEGRSEDGPSEDERPGRWRESLWLWEVGSASVSTPDRRTKKKIARRATARLRMRRRGDTKGDLGQCEPIWRAGKGGRGGLSDKIGRGYRWSLTGGARCAFLFSPQFTLFLT